MWLRLISAWMAASWLLEQVVLHRDWGRHVPTLRHMVSVDCLLLLRLLMHARVHLVLLGTTTCIRRPLPEVLRRTGTSLLSRSVGGEPGSWIWGCRISPRTLRWALVGGISPRHDAADWRQLPDTSLNNPLPTLVPNGHRRHSLHQESLDHRWGGEEYWCLPESSYNLRKFGGFAAIPKEGPILKGCASPRATDQFNNVSPLFIPL